VTQQTSPAVTPRFQTLAAKGVQALTERHGHGWACILTDGVNTVTRWHFESLDKACTYAADMWEAGLYDVEDSSVSAIASVPDTDILTPAQALEEALAEDVVVTVSMDGGCFVATAENGIHRLDATVIGREGDPAVIVMAWAVGQHRANVAALVNGEMV
jgi:hypothetical protein